MPGLPLACFLAHVRKRTRTTVPDDIDPIGVILARVGLHPHTPESRALAKACMAVVDGNLNAPSIMTGEKAADHILGKIPLAPSNQEPWINPRWQESDR